LNFHKLSPGHGRGFLLLEATSEVGKLHV
jgi:hypothetical protein